MDMTRCNHINGYAQHNDSVMIAGSIRVVSSRRCLDCGAWLSLGPANDDDDRVKVELRAAELAADMRLGVGIGGHRPDHCTGEHCWHYYADEGECDGPCCYCERDYMLVLPESVAQGRDYECQTGYLAACIADHDDADKGGAR
jgi:hypothetical protein